MRRRAARAETRAMVGRQHVEAAVLRETGGVDVAQVGHAHQLHVGEAGEHLRDALRRQPGFGHAVAVHRILRDDADRRARRGRGRGGRRRRTRSGRAPRRRASARRRRRAARRRTRAARPDRPRPAPPAEPRTSSRHPATDALRPAPAWIALTVAACSSRVPCASGMSAPACSAITAPTAWPYLSWTAFIISASVMTTPS